MRQWIERRVKEYARCFIVSQIYHFQGQKIDPALVFNYSEKVYQRFWANKDFRERFLEVVYDTKSIDFESAVSWRHRENDYYDGYFRVCCPLDYLVSITEINSSCNDDLLKMFDGDYPDIYNAKDMH